MEPKDKLDAFMRLAEFQQTGLERRINIEWKMTTVLWTAIFLATGYLRSNGIQLQCEALFLYLLFLTVYFVWLGFLGRANKIDKAFKEYYRNQAEQVLGISIEHHEHPRVSNSLYWGAWLWLEVVLTGIFLLASYLFLKI
jgi:hypothetical protein